MEKRFHILCCSCEVKRGLWTAVGWGVASQVLSGQGGAEEWAIDSNHMLMSGPEVPQKGLNGDPCLSKKCLTLGKGLLESRHKGGAGGGDSGKLPLPLERDFRHIFMISSYFHDRLSRYLLTLFPRIPYHSDHSVLTNFQCKSMKK